MPGAHPRATIMYGTTRSSADDVDLGLPPVRRLSSSADGPLCNGSWRGVGREGEVAGIGAGTAAGTIPETVVLVLGNFQGVVVLDMGLVKVGESRSAKLRIEVPETTRKSVTTVVIDPRHPPTGELQMNFDGELSLGRGESHEVVVTWQPESGGKFRGSLAFKIDGRFPAQVSVVGEAADMRGRRGGSRRKGDAREGRRVAKGAPAGAGGACSSQRRSSSQEDSSRGMGPYTSTYGKENRLSLSSTALRPAASASVLGSSTSAVLSQGTTNKRQQMLMYSKSRRLSLKPAHSRGKSAGAGGVTEHGSGGGDGVGGSKAALLRKSLNDKGWAEKQAAGFTNWLNYTLIGAEQPGGSGDSREDEEDHGLDAETEGVSSSPLKAMVTMRQEARQRMRAMLLFRSAEIRGVTETVADRTYDGSLSLRRDRVLHADVGLSGALIDLVLCYEPRWLLLGLETVFGEIVPMPIGMSPATAAKSGRMERSLKTFVAERLVKCPEIKARYGFRGRVASGSSEVNYNEELAQHTLVHFLGLVLFLDRAKAENLLHPCPCLFRKTAEVKSSVDMLKVFCQFLHGEGDFVRHLKKMGYHVKHVQSYIDEFDFRVSNLAVDLRDGVRLTRLMEVVTGEWGLADWLRVPAVSRLQKVFNTKKALSVLEREAGPVTLGSDGDTGAGVVTPKDVVDGDRHATLRLLWFIIARYSLSTLLDRDALAREAEGVVLAARKWRRAGFSPARPERAMQRTGVAATAAATAVAVAAGDDLAVGRRGYADAMAPGVSGDTFEVVSPGSPASPLVASPPSGGLAVAGKEHPPFELPDVPAVRQSWADKDRQKREEGEQARRGGQKTSPGGRDGEGNEELLSALLMWCQAVCHGYGVPVRNFTTSFSDGRVLCLLLHYYHPRIIPLKAIRRTTAHLPRIGGGSGELEDWSASLDSSKVTEAECRAALDGERANVALARHCVSELGGVPSMLTPFDSTNRPEEKTIITVVAYLCARLLESSAEIRSAILVQRVYRSFLERTGRGNLVARARAAKARKRAKAAEDRAAAAAAARAERDGQVPPSTPPTRRGLVGGAPHEQAVFVGEKQRAYLAATVIQRWWAFGAWRRRRRVQRANAAATMVQAVWRGRATRRAVRAELERVEESERQAAVCIQAAVRGRSKRQAFLYSRNAARVLQMWTRGRLQRMWYLALIEQLSAVVRLQSLARGMAGRRTAAAIREIRQIRATEENAAATTIQAWCRCRWAREQFSVSKQAAVRIQAFARGNAQASLYRKIKKAIVVTQALQRGVGLRARLSRERAAEAAAAAAAAAQAQRESEAASILQALCRRFLVRTRICRRDAAVVAVQAWVRGGLARTRAAERRGAVLVLQSWGRVALEELRYRRVVAAACTVQAWGRGVVARRRSLVRRDAVVRVQAWARGALEACRYRRRRRAAVALQALRRGVAARTRAVARRAAAVRVQAVVRRWIEVSAFREKRAAALRVQAWSRRMAAKAELDRNREAAIRLQAWTRASTDRKRFLRARNAAVVLQSWSREVVAARRFRELVKAAVTIQILARTAAAVTSYRRALHATRVIQAHWRGAVAVARYHKDISAAVTIQARWRAALEVSRYRRTVAASVAIQACLRRAAVVSRYRKAISAAVVIQAHARAVAAVARYRRTLAAVVTIQSAWRGVHERRRLARQAWGATKAQAWWRMVIVRARFRKEQDSATRLQSAWRGAVARATYERVYVGTVRLQAHARGVQARAHVARKRQEVAEFEAAVLAAKARAAAVAIQTWHRGHVATRRRVEAERAAAAAVRVAATVKVQAVVRGVVARRALKATVAAATVVQAYARGRRARNDILRRAEAAIKIQSVARAFSASLRTSRIREERRTMLLQASTVLQTAWRGAVARKMLMRTRAASITIQRWWRLVLENSRLAAARAVAEAKRVALEQSAATFLQACFRGHLSRAALRREAAAVVTVQALWRGRSGRSSAAGRKVSAVRLQAFARAVVAVARYRRSRAAAVAVQAYWRGSIARIRLAAEVEAAAAAAEIRAAREEGSVRVLQGFARGILGRAELKKTATAVVAVQAWWRMAAARAERRRARRGIVALQAILRGRAARSAIEAEGAAATAVVAWWRAALAARRYRRTRGQIVVLQSLARGRLGRKEVAARWSALGRRFSRDRAATMIQAVARGRSVRKKTGPGITSARARIEKANANARADPSQILGTRVNDALFALENCTHLTAIIRACIALELTSRYSKVCCEVMARSRCPQVLYELIRGLNRSPPHQKILKYAITTLRNIAQRRDNLPELLAAPPMAAETYVDLLQTYRERQEVFLPTVRLLQQLVAAYRPIKDECNSAKHAPRLESIRDILTRKAAVEAKSSSARGGTIGAGGGRLCKSLKALQLLLEELARD